MYYNKYPNIISTKPKRILVYRLITENIWINLHVYCHSNFYYKQNVIILSDWLGPTKSVRDIRLTRDRI